MRTVLAVAILASSGCATTLEDAVSQRAHGTSAVYHATESRAVEAAREVFLGVGADPVTVEGGRITGASLFPLHGCPEAPGIMVGNFMAAWVEPEGPDTVRVTVVTRRRSAFEFPMNLTESVFHERMRAILAR